MTTALRMATSLSKQKLYAKWRKRSAMPFSMPTSRTWSTCPLRRLFSAPYLKRGDNELTQRRLIHVASKTPAAAPITHRFDHLADRRPWPTVLLLEG